MSFPHVYVHVCIQIEEASLARRWWDISLGLMNQVTDAEMVDYFEKLHKHRVAGAHIYIHIYIYIYVAVSRGLVSQ